MERFNLLAGTAKRTAIKAAPYALGLGLCAMSASAQFFSGAAQSASTEGVAVARYLGILVMVICGLSMAFGSHGMWAKAAGAVVGCLVALNASTVAQWAQGL